MLSRWFVAGSSALLLLGSNVPAQAEEPSLTTDSYEYKGSWEYRWGDSPGQTGAYEWARSGFVEGWRPLKQFSTYEGRGHERFLWLRTRLEGNAPGDPILHLQSADQWFEAYLDGQMVYRFAEFEVPKGLTFWGYKSHDIPLGSNFAGRTLALRIYSEHLGIGPHGQPLLGPRSELTLASIRADLPALGMGVILLAFGLIVLALYSWDRENKGHLLYGLLTFSLGLYLAVASPIRGLLLNNPVAWLHVELAGLYVVPILFAAYVDHTFGADRFRILRALRWTHAVYFGAATLAVILGLVGPLQTLVLFQALAAVTVAVVAVRAVIGMVRGDLDARIFGIGFLVAASMAVPDAAAALGLIARTNTSSSHLGVFLFTLALGLIVMRRIMAAQERAGKYSRILELSLASAQVLERGQHARVGLDEIMRLLPIQKALLFVMKPGPNSDLELVTAREPGEKEIPADKLSYHTDIVDEVRTQRAPIMQKRVAGTQNTVIAEPLIVRDELLGVLYLEGNGSPRGLQESDRSILHILGEKLSITIVTTRAIRAELDSAVQKKLIGKQTALLEAAARLAAGDIETPIVVEGHGQFADLARALDTMRRDVQAKIHTIESKKAEVEVLNEELRRKIQQHTTSLLSSLRDDEMDDDDELVGEDGPTFEPGTVIADRYRVSGDLGQGAMGVVYDVERIRDGRHFAMKVLTSRRDKVAMTRMVREAQILARMDHPNLASIADVDVTPDGLLYLVMELCEGEPLQRHKARFRNVPWALSVLRQMAQGLAAVHAQGVIHRDLKPGNVMVSEKPDGSPAVKLVDFGISTLTREALEGNPVSERGRDIDAAPVSRRSTTTWTGFETSARDSDSAPNSRRSMPTPASVDAGGRDLDLPSHTRRAVPTLTGLESGPRDFDLPPPSRRSATTTQSMPALDLNDLPPPSRRSATTTQSMPALDLNDLPPPSRRSATTTQSMPALDLSDLPPPSRRSATTTQSMPALDLSDLPPAARRAGSTISTLTSLDFNESSPPSKRPNPSIATIPAVDISDMPPPSRKSSPGMPSPFRDPDAPPPSRRSVPPPPVQEVTRTGILVGTPTYMGPELAQGSKQWKAHSDVFSFGVMAYEILTAKKAFNVPPIFAGMQGQPLPRPTGLRRVKGLEPDVAALLERCVDADPTKRPTAAEVAERLARAEATLSTKIAQEKPLPASRLTSTG